MKPMYTVKDIAEVCRVKPTTVHRWVKEGAIPPPIRLNGKTMMWKPEAIENWIASQPSVEPANDHAN